MGHTQPFVTTTIRQLQGLGDELNFPDSASLKFDIEAVTISLDVPIDLQLCGPNACKSIFDRNVEPINIVFRGAGKPGKK